MTDPKTKSLPNNDSFCMLPWVHQFIHTNGDVLPCCIADYTMPMGNVKKDTVDSIWNNDKYKSLRKNMLQGQANHACNNCYNHEKHNKDVDSPRLAANRFYAQHADLVNATEPDGNLPIMSLKYLDIRWSNICNYKCRTCGEWNSSSWAAENKQYSTDIDADHTILHRASSDNNKLIDSFAEHMTTLEQVYFAGGEPLLMEEHYKFLQKLIEVGNTSVRLKYNTNLSVLEYKDINVLDLWAKFENIKLSISLDNYGQRAEYIRHGTVWADIVKNINAIKLAVPHARLSMNTVISVFNIATLPEFIEELRALGFLSRIWIKDSTLYPISNPRIYKPDILPPEQRDMIGTKLRRYISNTTPDMKPIADNLKNALSFFEGGYQPNMQKEFKKAVLKIDTRREESFGQTFPELADWFDSINVT